MIKQTHLNFKLGLTKDEIISRSELAIYSEFLRGFEVKDLIDKPMPASNRGYKAWDYIEPLSMMPYGRSWHIEDLREISEDTGLRELIGLIHILSVSTVENWFRKMRSAKRLNK
ncbi:MAG: hypothetical protein N3A59_04250 [Thermodesulfovibrionales bacterium]|nr:hypothetical protein [Thermodesulfovibrionales bacterium]